MFLGRSAWTQARHRSRRARCDAAQLQLPQALDRANLAVIASRPWYVPPGGSHTNPWLIGSPHSKRPRRRPLPPERIAARMVETKRNANRQGDCQRRRRLPAEARDLIPIVDGIVANSPGPFPGRAVAEAHEGRCWPRSGTCPLASAGPPLNVQHASAGERMTRGRAGTERWI